MVCLFVVFLDIIDIVKEQTTYGPEYQEKDDPKLYISDKTERGPLSENWLEDYWNEVLKSQMGMLKTVRNKRSNQRYSHEIQISISKLNMTDACAHL